MARPSEHPDDAGGLGLLLHVGYHKTGTTWLQRAVFQPSAGWHAIADGHELRQTLVRPRPLEYDPEPVAHALLHGAAEARRSGLAPVISDERLSGHPHSGGFDAVTIADRLATAAPHARVLIVVREQAAMARSCYALYVQGGGAHRLEAYLDPVDDTIVPLFSWDHLQYDRLVAAYQARFGADAVLVLPYELLVADAAAFVGRIHDHVGLPAPATIDMTRRNRSLGAAQLRAKRIGNLFDERGRTSTSPRLVRRGVWRKVAVAVDLAARHIPAGRAAAVEREHRATIARACAGRFEAGNRRLAALTGLDLEAYGYAV